MPNGDNQFKQEVARFIGAVEQFKHDIDVRLDRIERKLDIYDRRIGELREAAAYQKGLAAKIAAAISGAVIGMIELLRWKFGNQ